MNLNSARKFATFFKVIGIGYVILYTLFTAFLLIFEFTYRLAETARGGNNAPDANINIVLDDMIRINLDFNSLSSFFFWLMIPPIASFLINRHFLKKAAGE